MEIDANVLMSLLLPQFKPPRVKYYPPTAMIRPMLHQQLKSSIPMSLKSPIKKHLQASASETFCGDASEKRLDHSPLHGPLAAKLRASVLQAVLKLLDQDVNALAGAHEVLQAVASLPLAEPTVQRACVQALRGLHSSTRTKLPASSSNSNWDANEAADSRTQTMHAGKQTQSAKGLMTTSLHHCKEFLLACANEIHELEEVHPVTFDYAEDTSSSNFAQPSESQPEKCTHCGTANFDYASTVHASSEASEACSDDDTRADQGSQFSEVLRRAEFLSDVEDQESDKEVKLSSQLSLSINERVVCRKLLRALHEYVQVQRATQRRQSSGSNLALKFRVFEALKHQASLTRKRLAFQRLKKGLRSRHESSPTAPQAFRPSNSTFQMLMLHHSDVLLLLVALVFLANLPAKYIM